MKFETGPLLLLLRANPNPKFLVLESGAVQSVMEVVDISSSDSEDDESIVAVAEAMNRGPVDPVTVIGLKTNPSGQSTFQFSRKVKSRSAHSTSPNEHRPPPHGGIVITPKITSHFNRATTAPATGSGSAQKVIRRKSSEAKQPVRISIPMGGQQELKIQIGDKKLRRDPNATKKMKCPPKRQQQQQHQPELVVISDEEDDDTPAAGGADRQLTTALEESIRLDALERVKRTLKRNSEPEAGEERKRVKLERVAAEEVGHDPVDDAYATLLHVIRSKVQSGEFEKIERKLGKRISGIKVEHLSSVTLKEFLEKKRDLIRAETTGNHFKHIESVLDELKRYSKPANSGRSGPLVKSEPVPGTSSSLKPSESNPEDGLKLKGKKIPSRKHISKLENALQKCVKEIRRLEEAEDYDYDEENFDEENTPYIKLDRYRKQATKIYKKLSELKEFDASLGRRQDKKFKFEGSRYPEINAKIAKFINRSRSLGLNCMPDYWEILELIEAENEKGLGIPKCVMSEEAKDIFSAVGRMLAARRRHDEIVDREGYLPEDPVESVDPADNDEELAKKLGGEKRWREQEERVRVRQETKILPYPVLRMDVSQLARPRSNYRKDVS